MKLKSIVTRIFFPLKCPLCGELVSLSDEQCSCCDDEIRVISRDFCRNCGADTEKCTCEVSNGSCVDNIAGVYYYTGKIKWQIALFKFAGKKKLAKEMSLRMSERVAEVFSEMNFDAVTFVPSSEKSIEQRDFNQSELLAEGIAKRLFIPLEDVLIKVKETEFQHSLPAKERAINLDGAFAVREDALVKDKVILLCDDVKTTGTTLRKCADVLYEKGAKEVCCIVYALTNYLIDF